MADMGIVLSEVTDIEVQMEIAKILKQARGKKGVSQEQVIKELGISTAALSHVENGRHLPSYDLLERLAKYYGLDPAPLLAQLDRERVGRFVVRESIRYYRNEPAFVQFTFVPIINAIPAGHFIEVSPKTIAEADTYMPILSDELANKTGLLGFRVQGESMAGRGIHDGNIIVIDPALDPVNGDLVVISVNDEVVLKEFHHQGDKLILKSANPDFPDLSFPVESSNIHIYGKVIRVTSIWKP